MLFRKKGCLRQNIKVYLKINRKSDGQVEWVIGTFLLLFLGILLASLLQVEAYRTASFYLEDALAASNLASAIIDMEEYGISHTIAIEEPLEAYERYRIAVKENLQLNEQWEGTNQSLISGKVTVENYTVYNVRGRMVDIYSIDSMGQLTIGQGILGTIKAPNDVEVVSTGIYSELSFPIEGIFGVKVQAHKGKLVDIVAQVD